jgi:hypothetical protein
MANLIFKKEKLNPQYPVYEIEQSGGLPIETVNPGDQITFKRTGQDNNWGFDVTFVGTNPPSPITVAANPASNDASKIDWPVPGNKGTFKYIVSFPYDNTQNEPNSEVKQIVVPLDPVIIINPSSNLSRVALAAGLVVLGAALAYGAMLAMQML